MTKPRRLRGSRPCGPAVPEARFVVVDPGAASEDPVKQASLPVGPPPGSRPQAVGPTGSHPRRQANSRITGVSHRRYATASSHKVRLRWAWASPAGSRDRDARRRAGRLSPTCRQLPSWLSSVEKVPRWPVSSPMMLWKTLPVVVSPDLSAFAAYEVYMSIAPCSEAMDSCRLDALS